VKVPFLDLNAQYRSIKAEIDAAIQEVLDSSAFAGGPFVERFEREWAEYCGVRHAIGVGSGTDALWLILLALGIGDGDEVITVPNTFIATAEAITHSGAAPVFVDIDETYYGMDPNLLEAAITPRSRAIIPVHIFGQMADMDPIMEIASRHGLRVIEDACQAHGSTYRGRKAGSIGDAAAFSFYPGKNLGAYGEAGAITTNNEDLANKIRMLRDHGQSKKYYHDMVGWNARMDGIQGAVLSVKFQHLDEWNNGRRKHADHYRQLLRGVDVVVLPEERPGCRHNYHVYAVRVRERDTVAARLREDGIATGIHYPIPVHMQRCYVSVNARAHACHVSERYARDFLSLPMFPELTSTTVEWVSKALRGSVEHL
jgi:dTDP-4-amino-4,6-dideoxygalactose transaminase